MSNSPTNFYCDECGKHCKQQIKYQVRSRRGYEYSLCQRCIHFCKYCDEDYAPVDSYAHDDCEFNYHNGLGEDEECEFSECDYCAQQEEEEELEALEETKFH